MQGAVTQPIASAASFFEQRPERLASLQLLKSITYTK
jgi:hypothetical protein